MQHQQDLPCHRFRLLVRKSFAKMTALVDKFDRLLLLLSLTPSKDGLLAGVAVDSFIARDYEFVDGAPPMAAPST